MTSIDAAMSGRPPVTVDGMAAGALMTSLDAFIMGGSVKGGSRISIRRRAPRPPPAAAAAGSPR